MQEHENVQRARDAYAAFAKGDFTVVGQILAEDVVLHTFGTSPLAGDFSGRNEVLGFFAKAFALTDSTLWVDIHAVTAHDDRAIALTHMTGRRGDRTLDLNSVQVFRLAGGLVKEMWVYEEDQAAADAFWS